MNVYVMAAPSVAIEPADMQPVAPLELTGTLTAVIAVCLLVALVLAILAIVLSKPRRKSDKGNTTRGAHRDVGSKTVWRERINSVVARHEAGELSRQEAFVQLAFIARDFATSASNTQLSASTLADLNRMDRTGSNREGLNALRQTIAALYPPEFANASLNSTAGQTSVQQAAEWVSTLVERWRA
ncbi:hypothetical protein [Bifidobacterium oedipodis]|uniref:Uncharacterized protein n=1 Tax=Bifidobacterium oedipodis TaxID=2675322 RepID=A0A7Y0HR52_9BIFI|nr:hypothetical protein [Bifidobacterium sp. DSM 109957]NMM93645.1 hypothetical protein [Bifidobacterium sp. DSM 109957]